MAHIVAPALGIRPVLLAIALSLVGCLRVGYDAEQGAADSGDGSTDGDGGEPTGQDDAGSVSDAGELETDARVDAALDATMGEGDAATDAGGDAATPLWDSDWEFRKPLTIHVEQLGANSGPLLEFPLLVEFASDDELSADVGKPDGSDIAFALADGTALDHEVEHFDAITGALVAWVRIPELSLLDDTTIYLYYGNPLATAPNPAAVWDSNFLAVHHMASLLDSTQHHNDLTAVGDAHPAWEQAIGQSAALDGDGDGYTLADIAELRNIPQLTISAWVRSDQLTDVQNIIGRVGAGPAGWGMTSGSGAGTDPEGSDDLVFAMGELGPDGQGRTTQDNVILNPAQLQHWVCVFDGAQSAGADRARIFVDGAEHPTFPYGDPLPALTPSSLQGEIAIGSTPQTTDILGTIDEVRLSSTARDAAWIATEYANQFDPESFVTAGPVQFRGD